MKNFISIFFALLISGPIFCQTASYKYDSYGQSLSTQQPLSYPISVLDAGNEWESIGPFGGDVFDIAIDPTDTEVVYLAAGYPYMRFNEDDQWMLINSLVSLSPSGIHCIEANDAGIIYSGGNYTYGKIFLSEDQGVTWQQKLLTSGNGVLNIAIDPSNQDVMYVTTTTNISGSTNKVIIKSEDAGFSWTPIDMTAWFPIGMACNDLSVDPDNSDIIVALGDGGFSYNPKAIISMDGGLIWQDISSGLPIGKPFNEVTIHNGTIYICGGQLFGGNTMGIYKSDDYGSSWQDISIGFPIKVANDMLISPDNADAMYAATEGDGVYYSSDGGDTWEYSTNGAGDNGSCRKIIFNPDDVSEIYGGFLSLGVCRSINGGDDWTSSSVGIASLKLNDIEIDPANPNVILASFEAENSGGCYLYDPDNEDWGLVSSLPATRFSAVSIGIDGRMYAWSNGPTTVAAEGVYRSSDDGDTWENMGPNIGSVFETQIYALVLSESDPDLIFIGGNNFGANGWASMIYRSTDAGGNWENVFMGPDNDGFKYLFIDPTSDDMTVYAAYKSEAAGAGFIKSIDGGDSWLPINSGISPATKWGSAIICDPATPDVLYGGAGGYGGTPGTVYKSEDGGSSWLALNISLGNNYSKITDLLLSPLDQHVIYAATSIDGVYLTEDGENFLEANDALPATNITGFSRLFENEDEQLGFYASSFSNSAFYTELYEPGTSAINNSLRNENRFSIYPNPASGRITITMDNPKELVTRVEIYSIEGKKVFASEMHQHQQRGAELSIEHLPGGVYQVVVSTLLASYQEKLVVID